MIDAFVPPEVVAVQSGGGAPTVMFAPPPRSALSGGNAPGAAPTPVRVQAPSASSPPAPAPPSSYTPAPTTAAAPFAASAPPSGSAPTPVILSPRPPTTPRPDLSVVTIPPVSQPLPSPGGVAPMTLLRTTLAATTPLLASAPAGVEPAAGLWVLATAQCPLPYGTDLNGWADCTQPLGFNAGELAVLQKPKAGNKAQVTGGLYSIARTRYRVAPLPAATPSPLGLPTPGLVQIDIPGVTGRSYIYVAVSPEIVDSDGRFVSARAWPVACPPPASPEVSRRGDRCVASSLQAVVSAAAVAPGDGGYILRWIDPTDAGSAGDTGGGRAYAPPPAPVFKPPRKLTPLEAAEPLPISDLPPELAAQQLPMPLYAPREEGDDSFTAPESAAPAKAKPAVVPPKPAAAKPAPAASGKSRTAKRK